MGGGTNSEKCLRFMPVDGVCNDNVRNGCTAGTPNDEAHDDNPSGYLWRCDGLHGGRNSDKCFIRVEDVVNGACDESVRNGCSAGTANAAAFPDSSTAYAWRCDGSNGGDNSDRCSKFIPVDGVCNDSVRNGASAGVCSNSGASCAVSAGNCPVSCGASWPSTPTGTASAGWDCFGSGAHARYCEWERSVYRRDCAEGCNVGDCSEVRTGPRRTIDSTCHTNHPQCR